MSRMIQNLVETGLVTRTLDSNNRRSVIIALSSTGLETFEQVEKDMEIL